jgi:hypothetical protein
VSVQIVGALLVLSIICTPAAAAMRVTATRNRTDDGTPAVPVLAGARG